MLKLTLIRVHKKKLVNLGMRAHHLTASSNIATKFSPRAYSAVFSPSPTPEVTKLLDWNVTSVAEQFTLIEFELFKAIELQELSNLAWKSDHPRRNASNVINILNRFDLVCQWASTEIVMAQSAKHRVSTVEKLILLAQKCLELRNYNSLMEIIAGLNRGSVQRLKVTWDAISNGSQTTLKALMDVVDVRYNYKTYREHLRKSALPCLPFFGVVLRDLSSLESENPAIEGENINFEKIYKTSKIFKDIQIFQQSAYSIAEDENLQPLLRRLLAMPEEMLMKHSQTVEPTVSSASLSPSSSPKMPRKSSASSSSVSFLSLINK